MDRSQLQEQINSLQEIINSLASNPVLSAVSAIQRTEERIRTIENQNAALVASIEELKEKILNADQNLS